MDRYCKIPRLSFDQNKLQSAFQANRESAITALTNDASAPYVYSGMPSGLAGDIAVLAHQFTKSQGLLATMTDGFNNEMTRVQKKQTDLDAYVQKITAQYQAQFTAMDKILASFKDTQNQLTQAFSTNKSN